MDLESVNNQLNNLFNNNTFKTVTSLILALYAGAAAPNLPNSVIRLFDTMIGKLLFIFLIGYVASKDLQISLMIAVAFIVTLTVANNRRAVEGYANFEGYKLPIEPDEIDGFDSSKLSNKEEKYSDPNTCGKSCAGNSIEANNQIPPPPKHPHVNTY